MSVHDAIEEIKKLNPDTEKYWGQIWMILKELEHDSFAKGMARGRTQTLNENLVSNKPIPTKDNPHIPIVY